MSNNEQRVLIGPSAFAELDSSPMDMMERAGCVVVPNQYKRRYTKEEIIDQLNGITGLLAGLEPLDRDVLESAKALKVISRCGSGMSNVDIEAAKEFGIAVRNTPNGPTNSVAELTIGCMLGALRMVPQMNKSLHEGIWDKRIGGLLGGRTVAVVGYGRIGRRVCELLEAFGVTIMVVDPFVENVPANVQSVSLEKAVECADIITLHLAGEELVLGEEQFALMKRGVVVLNAARGGSVNEEALIKALDEGIVAAAWLDALPEEPYTGKLTEYAQVILTPHVASYTKECRLEMECQAAQNLIDALKAA